jgi:hypothetical protein
VILNFIENNNFYFNVNFTLTAGGKVLVHAPQRLPVCRKRDRYVFAL